MMWSVAFLMVSVAAVGIFIFFYRNLYNMPLNVLIRFSDDFQDKMRDVAFRAEVDKPFVHDENLTDEQNGHLRKLYLVEMANIGHSYAYNSYDLLYTRKQDKMDFDADAVKALKIGYEHGLAKLQLDREVVSS